MKLFILGADDSKDLERISEELSQKKFKAIDSDENFESSVKGLYSIGDGGGMTRGLMMASCSGIQMARNLK